MLGVGLHFAKGQGLPLGEEHRIIAETLGPAGRPNEATIDLALERSLLAVRPGEAQGGGEVGKGSLPAPRAAVGEFVVDALHGDGEVAVGTGPARRIDA